MSRWLLIPGWLCLCFESYSQAPGNDIIPLDTLNPAVPKAMSKASMELDSLKDNPIEILDSLKDVSASKLDTLQKLESKFHGILGDARDTIHHQVPKLPEISPVPQNLPGNTLDINAKIPDQDLKIIPNMGLELDAHKLPDTNFSTPSLDTNLSLPDVPYDTAGLDKETLANKVEQEAESRLMESNLINIPDQGLPDQGDLLATEFEGMDYFPDDPNWFKKEALQKSQIAIQEKFRANIDKIQAAQQHMAELKQKYKSIESLKDGKFLKVNSLKDKTFIERSLIGVSVRAARSPRHPRGDFGIYYGYRLNKKWTINWGYFYRLEFDPDEISLASPGIHGPMVFTQYMVKRDYGFFLDYEKIYGLQKEVLWIPFGKGYSSDQLVIAGISKSYKISKDVRGNIRLGYNLLYGRESHHHLGRFALFSGIEIN